MAKKRTNKKKAARARQPSAHNPGTLAPEAKAQPASQAVPDKRAFPLAGMAASAGGLDAFKKFFSAMPSNSGIAFVLIPHLDPTHESLMVELIARQTPMPVVEATEGMRVEPDHVYIIPPNKYMTISDCVLRLTGPVARGGLQTPIDLFLRSLAEDRQEQAICIILSGTGAHGTLGLRAVKGNGGMSMVQEPKSAEYDRMPQSAIATGLADYVLTPEEMPEALVRYVQHSYLHGQEPDAAVEEAPDHLRQVLALLRARAKYDFSCYRKKMLLRRIERRMGLNHIEQVPAYLGFLRENPDEIKQLVRDLLISVTSFFRDPDAFGALAEVLPSLVQSKDDDEPVRVWVPACATGEEAFSIAILLLEQLAATHKTSQLQVFATDLDEMALATARQAVYPDSIAADVSSERLSRFFFRTDEHCYRVNKALRDAVVFAIQSPIADPPFSKLDLISCRNLLIYLEPEMQRKIIALFHFALNEGGYLFLGPSETIGRETGLFEPVNKKWRVYRRVGPARPAHVDFPLVSPAERRSEGKAAVPPPALRPNQFAELTQRLLLESYAPAAVLINRAYQVLYFFGATMRYLDQPTGEPTHDLMLLARDGLRTKLRAMVHRASRELEPIRESGIGFRRNGDYVSASVTVRPVHVGKGADSLLLLTFEDEIETPAPQPAPQEHGDSSLVGHLEYELKATREDLQSTIEELESANEELKAANEEVMSMNEELQSANEELETSKEELQSLNEELSTVNGQLQDKVEDLETANNDMANLFNSTDIGTLFLDTNLRIKRFTPAATSLFNLIASDVGRPISDIVQKFNDPSLFEDAQRVQQELTPIQKEVPTHDERWCIRRILPYRTTDNRIDGVVINFVDISDRRRIEEHLRQLTQELAQRVGGAGTP
jgi:two-component system CheB/CheR fusion protein